MHRIMHSLRWPLLLGVAAAVISWLINAAADGSGGNWQLWPVDEVALWRRGAIALLLLTLPLLLLKQRLRRPLSQPLNEALELASDAFVTVDRNWRINYCNASAATLLRRDHHALVGTTFWDSFPEAASRFLEPLTESLDSGRSGAFRGYCAALQREVELRTIPHPGGMLLSFSDLGHHLKAPCSDTNERLRHILNSATDSIITIDQRGLIRTFNHTAEITFGWRASEVLGRNVNLLMESGDALHHNQHLQNYLRSGVSKIIDRGPREVVARRRDGSHFDAELAIGEMALGEERHFVGVLRDISARKQSEALLKHNQAVLARAQALARLGSWEYHIADAQFQWSDEMFHIFGCEPGSFEPSIEQLLTRVYTEDQAWVSEFITNAIAGDCSCNVEYRIVHPDGAIRVVHVQGELIRRSDGTPVSMVGTLQDVSERSEARKTIETMANYDPVTGLPNRALLQYRLDAALQQARREGTLVGLLFIGIDRFKGINDTFGHKAGDELLKLCGQRLEQGGREGDSVARLGGDEFAVVLFGIDDPDEAAQIAHQLQQSVSQPLTLQQHELVVSCCVGIALYPHDGDSVEQLLHHADTALHRAKDEGAGSYQFFAAAMTRESQQRLKLEHDLRQAIEQQAFELHYQPQLALNSQQVVGVEALLRWRHQDRLISPAEFIPVLEETGLILPVSMWVLRTACAQGVAWRAAGLPPLRIAVNLSPLQFREPHLVEQISEILEQTGFDARWLELELTERLLVENIDLAVQQLTHLHAMGVQLAIDDFGTGYSSMSYLQHFTLHTLKLDRSFVSHLAENSGSAAISRAIIALAHNLGLSVIAEGIEEPVQAQWLHDSGCDEGQGYLYGRPMAAADLAHWLSQQTAVHSATAQRG